MTHVGTRARNAAGGCAARYCVGVIPNIRPKLVVNEPTLRSPTVRQMSATERCGALEPADQQVLVGRFAELAAELAAEVRRRQPRRASERLHVERLAVARVDEILRAKKVASRVR